MSTAKPRITIRLSQNQMMVLNELKDALGISYSLLTRTIILWFLKQNDDLLQDIIDGKKKIDFNEIIEDNNE